MKNILKYILLYFFIMESTLANSAIIQKEYQDKISLLQIKDKNEKIPLSVIINVIPTGYEKQSDPLVKEKFEGRKNEILDGMKGLEAKSDKVISLNLEYDYKTGEMIKNDNEINKFIGELKDHKDIKLEIAAPFTVFYAKPNIAREAAYKFEENRLIKDNINVLINIANQFRDQNLEFDFQTCTSDFFKDYISQNIEKERDGSLKLKFYPGFLYMDNRVVKMPRELYEELSKKEDLTMEDIANRENRKNEIEKELRETKREKNNKEFLKNNNSYTHNYSQKEYRGMINKKPERTNLMEEYSKYTGKDYVEVLIENPELILLSQKIKDDKSINFSYPGVLTPVLTTNDLSKYIVEPIILELKNGTFVDVRKSHNNIGFSDKEKLEDKSSFTHHGI
jgi:hypothetical protein